MSVLKLLRPQNLDRLYMLKRVLVMRIPEEEYFRLLAQHRPREVTGVLEIDRLQPGELLICSLVTGPSCVMQIQEGEAGGYGVGTGAMDPALSELLREGQHPYPSPFKGTRSMNNPGHVLIPVSKGVRRGEEITGRPRWKKWGNALSKLWTREV